MAAPVKRKRQPDLLLLLGVLGLLAIGVIMVFSASQYMAADSSINDGFYYLKKQCLWAALGLVLLFLMQKIDYSLLKKLAWPGLIAAIGLLVLVKVGAGVSSLGAERSIVLGPIHFQPSEFAKLALILFFAYNMSKHNDKMGEFGRGFLCHLGILGVFCGLIMLQPDLGTCVALVGAAFIMMWGGGVKYRYLIAMIVLGCGLIALAIILEPFRMARFTAFLDPWADPL
ncbi:MAG: FtsW/RodA/SpoVE family cell cycle protein, partial [Bacillota bacterium]|nr:FtsW/RodA/SpoVE family cell cycle protein [Bacillota bacterium]